MFGLQSGGQKKPKKTELFFDLELQLNDPEKKKELFSNIENKIQRLKALMRSGENQESFHKYNTLLQGYNSVLKVLSRLKVKNNFQA